MNANLFKNFLRAKTNYENEKNEVLNIREDLAMLDQKSYGVACYSSSMSKLISKNDKLLNHAKLKILLIKALGYHKNLRNQYREELLEMRKEIEEELEKQKGYNLTELQVFYYYNVIKKTKTLEEISYILNKDFNYIRQVNANVNKKIKI